MCIGDTRCNLHCTKQQIELLVIICIEMKRKLSPNMNAGSSSSSSLSVSNQKRRKLSPNENSNILNTSASCTELDKLLPSLSYIHPSDAANSNMANKRRKRPRIKCSVHTFKLYYASTLDARKYDKCQMCHELNEYDTMHFIYQCVRCKYFVCNFCFADLYNQNQTNYSPHVINAGLLDNNTNCKKSKKDSKTAASKRNGNARSRHDSELNANTNGKHGPLKTSDTDNSSSFDIDQETGSIASRTRNQRRRAARRQTIEQ